MAVMEGLLFFKKVHHWLLLSYFLDNPLKPQKSNAQSHHFSPGAPGVGDVFVGGWGAANAYGYFHPRIAILGPNYWHWYWRHYIDYQNQRATPQLNPQIMSLDFESFVENKNIGLLWSLSKGFSIIDYRHWVPLGLATP